MILSLLESWEILRKKHANPNCTVIFFFFSNGSEYLEPLKRSLLDRAAYLSQAQTGISPRSFHLLHRGSKLCLGVIWLMVEEQQGLVRNCPQRSASQNTKGFILGNEIYYLSRKKWQKLRELWPCDCSSFPWSSSESKLLYSVT